MFFPLLHSAVRCGTGPSKWRRPQRVQNEPSAGDSLSIGSADLSDLPPRPAVSVAWAASFRVVLVRTGALFHMVFRYLANCDLLENRRKAAGPASLHNGIEDATESFRRAHSGTNAVSIDMSWRREYWSGNFTLFCDRHLPASTVHRFLSKAELHHSANQRCQPSVIQPMSALVTS